MVGTDQAARRSGRFKCVVQDQQVVRCAGSDRAGTPLIVAELDQQGIRVELLDNSSDLPACQLACWNVCEEGDEIEQGGTVRIIVHCNTPGRSQNKTRRRKR